VQLENRPYDKLDSPPVALPLAVIMRRSSLSWLLSLLLVLVQHGAVLHELGHLSHGERTAGTTLRADPGPLDRGPCLTCEAFAQIANPAAAGAADVAVCPAALLPTRDPCYAVIGADTPAPRSRGPPQV
jgi:hypothetical protein